MKFDQINKIFIVSSGRTGTKFLGENLQKIVHNSLSVHEPDKVELTKKHRAELINKFKKIGIIELIINKALGISGTRNLSLRRINNEIEFGDIIKKIRKPRNVLLGDSYYRYYFEANWQLFGLLDDLFNFQNSKIIIFFRDPRTWVQSWMNKGYWYDDKDLLTKIDMLGFKRVTPKNVGIDNPEWKQYTRFQKLCWVWNYMNGLFYEAMGKDKKNIKAFYFEDIFVKKNKTKVREFLQFSLNEQYRENYTIELLDMLDHKVNQTKTNDFPHWQYWNDEYAKEMEYFCGDLMLNLGYGEELGWQRKIKK